MISRKAYVPKNVVYVSGPAVDLRTIVPNCNLNKLVRKTIVVESGNTRMITNAKHAIGSAELCTETRLANSEISDLVPVALCHVDDENFIQVVDSNDRLLSLPIEEFFDDIISHGLVLNGPLTNKYTWIKDKGFPTLISTSNRQLDAINQQTAVRTAAAIKVKNMEVGDVMITRNRDLGVFLGMYHSFRGGYTYSGNDINPFLTRLEPQALFYTIARWASSEYIDDLNKVRDTMNENKSHHTVFSLVKYPRYTFKLGTIPVNCHLLQEMKNGRLAELRASEAMAANRNDTWSRQNYKRIMIDYAEVLHLQPADKELELLPAYRDIRIT